MFKNKKIISVILAVAMLGAMSTSVFADVNTEATDRYGVLTGTLTAITAKTTVGKNPGDAYLTVRVSAVNASGDQIGYADRTSSKGALSLSFSNNYFEGTYSCYGTHGVTGVSSAAVYTYTQV